MSKTYIVSRNGGTVTKAPVNDNKIPIYANETALDADLANIPDNTLVATRGGHDDVIDQMKAYIRDQNELSGWYNFYTYNNNSFIMAFAPYDGFIAGATTATGSKNIECFINDTSIAFMSNGGAGTSRFGELAFRKGDKVEIRGNSDASYCFVCFYEKRDYSNRQ